MHAQSLTRGIACVSLGCGVAKLAAPKRVARTLGVAPNQSNLLRLLGLRQLVIAAGLWRGHPTAFHWARVGGDALDLALLATALRRRPSHRKRILTALAAVAGITAIDVAAAVRSRRNPARPPSGAAEINRAKRRDRAGESWSHAHAPAENSTQAANYWTPRGETREREDAATRQFGEGD